MNKTGLKYLIAVSSAFFSMDKIGLAQINYQENKESQTQAQQAKLKRIEAEIQSLKNQIKDNNANLPGNDFTLKNIVFAGKLGGKYVSNSGSVTKAQNLLKRVVGQPNGIWLGGKIEDKRLDKCYPVF